MILNQSFSLFSSEKENEQAAADDLLAIFPYLLL